MEFLTSLEEGTQFAIQLLVVLICLFYGAKKGGIALGLLGGIGLIVLVFGFNIQPGKPAIDVMLQIAERILRKNPKYVSILAPFVTATLTILCGTGHVVYTMLPIVYDIAIKNGIRPERPMAASSISAQLGIIASPVSVAVVTLTAQLINAKSPLAGFDGYLDLLKITIPSTFCGVLAIGIFSWSRGKDLDKDEEFQEKIKDPEFKQYVYGDSVTLLGKKLPGSQWAAMWIFLSAIAIVAVLGYYKDLRPSWDFDKRAETAQIVSLNGDVLEKINIKGATLSLKEKEIFVVNGSIAIDANASANVIIKGKNESSNLKQDAKGVTYTNAQGEVKEYADAKLKFESAPLSMVNVIQIFMLLAGSLIIIFTKTDTSKIGKNEIFKSGMIALVAVFGISWMAETMFAVHTPMMKAFLGGIVQEHPWTYAVMLLLISKFVNSQAAALVAFVPLALGIGVNPAIILAFAPACYGYYILPTYPSDLAAIQFDRSGTTKIGKFVINHSFIIPGLLGVFTSCVFGYIFTNLFGYL